MYNKKGTLITAILFFLFVSIGTISMIEYYYAKDSGRMPILAIKKADKAKQLTTYSSILYNVYKCDSGFLKVTSKSTPEPVCERLIRYDDGYYLNSNNLKISQIDYQAIYNISNTEKEIEEFKTKDDVNNSILLATEYEKNKYKTIKTIIFSGKTVNIVSFKELVLKKNGDYSWEYIDNSPKCLYNDTYNEYKDGICTGEWKKISYSKKWCELASTSSRYQIKEVYKKYCD